MSNADLWYVMLADGDVHRVTLDQLDEAFQAGHVDKETLVLAQDARQWTPLGQLAGLDDTPPAPQVPVTTSFRPVSVDLSEVEIGDLGDVPFRTRPGKKWVAMLGGLAVVGTIAGVAINRPGWAQPYVTGVEGYVARAVDRAMPSARHGAAAAPPPMAAEPAVPATNTAPAPLPSTTAVSAAAQNDPAGSPAADRFSPNLKQKLIDADKQRDLKAKARARSVTPPASRTSAKYKFGGFTTGGNKFDPLNSAIP
jgi:uncharacterized protein DUF4339